MGKRIFLFIVTNIAIVLTLSVVAAFLGVGSGIGPEGLNLQALAVFCLFWGMGGAFISLQMSRWIAKRATGVAWWTAEPETARLTGSTKRLRG